MNDLDARLIRCFRAVFVELDEAAARQASRAAMEDRWDSLASITLVSTIEQEFGVEIDLFDLAALESFAALQQHLAGHITQA